MAMDNTNTHNPMDRSRERAYIDQQVRAFLEGGGEIKVIKSAFEIHNDPKCRLGEDVGILG